MYGYICPDCGCHLDPGGKMRLQGGKRKRERKGDKDLEVSESGNEWSDED